MIFTLLLPNPSGVGIQTQGIYSANYTADLEILYSGSLYFLPYGIKKFKKKHLAVSKTF